MPAAFEAKFSRLFLDDLKKLDLPTQRRILEAIETKLLTDPFQHSKELADKPKPGRWRFRVGDYRVRFDIAGNVLLLYRVRHRREIYQ